MSQKAIRFGLIGSGLMAREFASATLRWAYLLDLGVRPEIVAVAARRPEGMAWFTENLPHCRLAATDYRALLDNPQVDAVYCAVSHHLHAQMYSVLQMLAAFCDQLANGQRMRQPFGWATPAETAQHHRALTAALEFQRTGQIASL